MRLEFCGESKAGAVRRQNEDSILAVSRREDGLFIVADGIGGRRDGAVVSGLICGRFEDWWNDKYVSGSMSFPQAVEGVKLTLFRINEDIVNEYGSFAAGSTIALLLVKGDNCLWLSSGDSRIYRARGLGCEQLTQDDTFENLPERPKGYKGNNAGKLVGAVGINGYLEYTIKTGPVKRGDRFFLCSDGVYKYHSVPALKRRLALSGFRKAPGDLLREVALEVEKNGAGDNYSMIFVRVE